MFKLKHLPRFVIYALEVLAGLTAAAALVFGLVGYQIYKGAFVTSYLDTYLQRSFLGGDTNLNLKIGSTLLTWDHNLNTLVLVSRDIALARPDSTYPLLSVDKVYMRFSRPRLLALNLAPVIVEFSSPEILLEEADTLADSSKREVVSSLESAEAARFIIAPIYYLKKSRRLGDLESFTINNISVKDPQNNVTLVEDASLIFYRNENRLNGQFAADLKILDTKTNLDGEMFYDLDEDLFEIRTSFNELATEQVHHLHPALLGSLPVSGIFSGSFGSAFKIAGEDEDMEIQPLYIRLNLTSNEGNFTIEKEELPYTDLALDLRYSDRRQHMEVERLMVDLGALQLEGTGQIQFAADKNRATLFLKTTEVDIEKIIALWPESLAEKARPWCVEHLKKGKADAEANLTLSWIKEKIDLEKMEGQGTFSDLETGYFRTFPVITGGKGQLKFNQDQLEILAEGAIGNIKVSEGRVLLHKFDQDPPVADIQFRVEGAVPEVLAILDRDPIYLSKKFPYPLASLQGNVNTTIHFLDLPMINEVIPDEAFKLEAGGILEGLQSEKFAFDLPLANAQFFMTLTEKQVNLRGPMTLKGVTFNLDYTQVFSRNEIAYNVEGALSTQDRKNLEILDEEYLKGPLAYTAKIREQGGRYTVDANLDLTPLTVEKNFTNWTKNEGQPATAEVSLAYEEKKGVDLSSFKMMGPDLKIDVAGTLTDEFKPANLKITTARIGTTFVSGQAVREGPVLKVSLKGPYLDLSEHNLMPESEKDKGRLAFDGAFEQVDFGGDDTIKNTTLKFERENSTGRYAHLDLVAHTPDFVKITASIVRDEKNSRRLLVETADAGQALRGFNVYDNMYDGKLTIDGRFDDKERPSKLYGSILVDKFRIVRAPVLAQLLNVAFLTGVLDLLKGEGIHFEKLTGTFTYQGDILNVERLHATGASAGIYAVGVANTKDDTVDVEGSVAPAYTINKFLGNVPFFGMLLKGGGEEELIAARYSVRGPMDNPQVMVNPLSALTPGIFRNIFGQPDVDVPEVEEEAPATPEKAPAPTAP